MSTIDDIFVASASRRLTVRKRLDLVAERQSYQGRSCWMLKDPIGAKYYRLQDHEYALFERIDGHTNVESLREWYQSEYPDQSITVDDIQNFLFMLHRNGLVLSDAAGQGRQLVERRQRKRRQKIVALLSNLLFIRLKGFDPERLLSWLYPRIQWAYSRPALALSFVWIVTSLLLVLVQFDEFRARLPSFHDFFATGNWLWLAVAIGTVKLLHEFGHGLTCKHFGGECHEMGMLLFVFTPSLYCNVSDSWLLPNKWHRIAIGAAGMYVELVIAATCTYLWWFSQPGLFNQLCLNTMFVCSVSTVLFNSNPLLRYDGYYIVSDLLEIPNLATKSKTLLGRKVRRWCLGIKEPKDNTLPTRRQGAFVAYAVASTLYRWLLVTSILLLLYTLFEPYGLKVVGQALMLLFLAGVLGRGGYSLWKFFATPGRLDQMKRRNAWITTGAAAALLLALLFVPLPRRVTAAVEVQPAGARSVYVDVAGSLVEPLVRIGERVARGQPIARLENVDLELLIAELETRRDSLRSQFENLSRERFERAEQGNSLRSIQKALAAVEEQLVSLEKDQARLTLLSPAEGVVLPPPAIAGPRGEQATLPTWSGTPLESRNIGAFLPVGTLFCYVGDPQATEAMLVVEQSELELIAEGQPVSILLHQTTGQVYESTIRELSAVAIDGVSPQLSTRAGGDVITRVDGEGREKPFDTSYQARAALPADVAFRSGLSGRARIHAAPQTLAARLLRFAQQTFHFRM